MKVSEVNIGLIEGYYELLKNLSPDSKLELIAKLSDSMKSGQKRNNDSLKSLYGAFISEKSAEEIIKEIKDSRNFSSKRESL